VVKENPVKPLYREIKEELSIELDLKTLQYVGTFSAQAHGHPTGTLVQMACYTAAYTGILKASAEIEEIVWLSYADTDKISAVDKIIFQHFAAWVCYSSNPCCATSPIVFHHKVSAITPHPSLTKSFFLPTYRP